MVIEIRQHVELRGNNLLEAKVAGTQHEAYLVANLAVNDGPQTAAFASLRVVCARCFR